MIRYFLLLLFPVFLISCGEKKGKILPKEKMMVVLWDIFQAESFTDQYIKKDSSKNAVLENAKLQQQLFALHGISRDDYERSYAYYKAQPDEMKIIIDSITARTERNRSNMMMKKYIPKEKPKQK
ncbi:MAG: DUF4296 domain-containing protein [Ferruginibacter sp.]